MTDTMKTEQRREAFEKWHAEFVETKRRVPTPYESWCAALDSQAAQAQPRAWIVNEVFLTDDRRARELAAALGCEVEPLYAASPSHSEEPGDGGGAMAVAVREPEDCLRCAGRGYIDDAGDEVCPKCRGIGKTGPYVIAPANGVNHLPGSGGSNGNGETK